MRFTKMITGDGSETLHDARVDESYRSSHAARTETEAVFLNPGVVEHPLRTPGAPFRVLELGLGLGTNINTLYRWWQLNPHQSLEIVTVDFDLSGLHFLASDRPLGSPLLELLRMGQHQEGGFAAKVLELEFSAALEALKTTEPFHVVFFDPFSPKSEPGSWRDSIFTAISQVLPSGGRVVTYSVSRRAKDGFTRAGFSWKKLPLPPILHKRDSLLASKP